MSEGFRMLALLGMLPVIAIHCISSFKLTSPILWAAGYDGFFRVAVPFFFLVSGMFLGRHVSEPGWWRREVGKRCRSLVVPYFVWLALYFVFRTTMLLLAGRQIDFSAVTLATDFGIGLFEYPGLRPLWYVRALFLLVLVSPAFVWVVRKVGVWPLFLLLPFAHLSFFPLGLAVGMGAVDLRMRHSYAAITLLVGVGLMSAAIGCQLSGAHVWWTAFHGLALSFLVLGGINLVPVVNLPREVTSTTFPIFLLHMFFVSSVGILVRNLNWKGLGSEIFVLAFATFGVFFLAMALALLLRRFVPRLNAVLWGGR